MNITFQAALLCLVGAVCVQCIPPPGLLAQPARDQDSGSDSSSSSSESLELTNALPRERLIDGCPLDKIPARFYWLLLHTDGLVAASSCDTPECQQELDEYEQWRQENGYGKSQIRW